MEGTIVVCWKRRTTERTRRWRKASEPAASGGSRSTRRGTGTSKRDRCEASGPDAGSRRSVLRPPVRTSVRSGRNGREATAAAMRYGCRRGENLRRVRSTVGEPASVRSRARESSTTTGSGETQWTPGPGPGCNMLGARRWRKPSRWCETTRTERDVMAWLPSPEGRSLRRSSWSGHRREHGGGAYTKDESHERKGVFGPPAPCRER